MTLSLMATWFLVGEARRGKKAGAGVDGAAGADGAGADPAEGLRCDTQARSPRADASVGAERVGAAVPLQVT